MRAGESNHVNSPPRKVRFGGNEEQRRHPSPTKTGNIIVLSRFSQSFWMCTNSSPGNLKKIVCVVSYYLIFVRCSSFTLEDVRLACCIFLCIRLYNSTCFVFSLEDVRLACPVTYFLFVWPSWIVPLEAILYYTVGPREEKKKERNIQTSSIMMSSSLQYRERDRDWESKR